MHWDRLVKVQKLNENLIILMKFSSMVALKVVKMTTFSTASGENFIKMMSVILMVFSLMAALKVVKMTTFSAASDENFIKMRTLLFQREMQKIEYERLKLVFLKKKLSPLSSWVIKFKKCKWLECKAQLRWYNGFIVSFSISFWLKSFWAILKGFLFFLFLFFLENHHENLISPEQLWAFRNHNNDVTWVSRQFKLWATQVFVQQLVQANNNENISAPYYWTFVRGIHQWLTNVRNDYQRTSLCASIHTVQAMPEFNGSLCKLPLYWWHGWLITYRWLSARKT